MAAGVRVLLPVLLAVSACGSSTDRVATPAAPSTPPPGPTSLEVQVAPEVGATPTAVTLTCDPPGGDHPDPEAACADLARRPAPFAPLAEDTVCAEVYGGPEQAVVRGTYRGEPVALELSRTDACRTGQWDGLGAVLSAVLRAGA
jgi:hypothetical protein